jgi:ABC-type antimicrobial peptide transport system permease subunit
VIYLHYMLSELRRRRGRTLLTALGLAIGVGLVITVNALSSGLHDAQAKVLKPLTGVGTDMSVTRPITISNTSGGFRGLSAKERSELQSENGGTRFGFQSLKPGSHFSRDVFAAAGELSFQASKVSAISKLAGVQAAAGGLTLTSTHVNGTIPERAQVQKGVGGGGPSSGGGVFVGPRNINFSPTNVSGVDQHTPALGAITRSQISSGRYFSTGSSREAILDVGYAKRKGLHIGDTVKLGGKKSTVVGLAKTPLGGQSSDIYVKLAQLQRLSGRVGRVNTVYVRATSSSAVGSVAKKITAAFPGSSVTTAKTLADRVSGSLTDAKNLTSKLGVALEIVGLLGAILIASLLTLTSVTKRVRELGTLKALGWSQRLVVRQVAGESLLQGLLGAGLGIVIGVGGAAAVGAFAPSLQATIASAAQNAFPGPGPFGQGAVPSTSTSVDLTAPISIGLIGLAVLLAVGGGLISGAVGALRASRLRPADALRHID